MKRTLLALSVAAAVSVGMTSTIFASAPGVETPAAGDTFGYQWISINNNSDCEALLKELFENCNIYFNDLFLKNCPDILDCLSQLPVCPKPDIPESSEPETDVPETSAPETDAPETSEPETDVPETSAPETDVPETSAPETDVPETSEPETDAPETSAPETDVPETSKPEVSEPETGETTTPDESVHPYVLRIVELVNEERAKAGLNPVTLDTSASEAALVRARETVQLFSHTRPDGRSCFTALTEQGVRYRTAGENIAYGQRSPEQVMEGWMNSSGHRANILGESFTHIGVGYYQVNGVNYWTQMFFS